MPRRMFPFVAAVLTIAALLLSLTAAQAADTERVLYSFNGVSLATPYSPLIMDTFGNLYGTSAYETANTNGTIFKLTKGANGRWSTTTLYEFRGSADGRNPQGALIFDAAGNLYGTTPYNGKSPRFCCGTVFELTPTASGPWKLTSLYSFKGGSDGEVPISGLIFDSAGNLYGTTQSGGASDYGTVFELSPKSGGGWTESILHSFQGGSDGEDPLSGLVLDKNGNLYGETPTGGGNGTVCLQVGCGTVFELVPNSGAWTEKVLYAFSGGSDGGGPSGSLVIDGSGNLYGAAAYGTLPTCDGNPCGVVFELSPGSNGVWTESVPHAFAGGSDGEYPFGPLVLNRAGHIFGAAAAGGLPCDCGAIFELSPSVSGWVESIVYTFPGGSDGVYPQSGLIEDQMGSFYGATYEGGAYNMGTIFKIIP